MTQWTRVESSQGENLELRPNASMREIKARLGITGRRCVHTAQFGQWRKYRLAGTTYTFTVTDCY